MSLTITPPAELKYLRHTHELSPAAHRSSTRLDTPPPSSMTSSHRGLPPPAAMGLPEPARGAQIPPPLGTMPAPPHQWQGAEDSMRNWLHAKAEEDKRRQEEEKTQQESLRLEQRRIEHSMLSDALRAGVPPHLIPIIFAAVGGANLAHAGFESAQQYFAHVQQQLYPSQSGQLPPPLPPAHAPPSQQQPLPPPPRGTASPDTRREHRHLPDKSYPPGISTQAAVAYPSPAYQQSPVGGPGSGYYAGVTSTPTQTHYHANNSRGLTNEAHLNQPPAPTAIPPPSQPQEPAGGGLSIYHWHPPSTTTNQSTPSGKESQKSSPNQTSTASGPDSTSPKRRKLANDPKPPSALVMTFDSAPTPPSSGPRNTSSRRSSDPPHRAPYDPIGKANRQDARSQDASGGSNDARYSSQSRSVSEMIPAAPTKRRRSNENPPETSNASTNSRAQFHLLQQAQAQPQDPVSVPGKTS